MKKKRLGIIGWIIFLASILCINGFYGMPTAIAAQSDRSLIAQYAQPLTDTEVNYCNELGYLPPDPNLTEAENQGRCTWYLWTGGNEKFYNALKQKTNGAVNLLSLIDSRQHDERFSRIGAINDPGCEKATAPDEYGLWLDNCSDPHSTGVMGLRKFANPNFVAANWDALRYGQEPNMEPPYRIGLTCGVCHIAFNPLNPPQDPNKPLWENLVAALGNQYLEEGRLFAASLQPDDFRWHVINAQQPGTSDTSRISNDHINNPNTINPIFNLRDRPRYPEVMNDGSIQAVNHILKDGADSTGVANASLRVYVNIGTCGDYWMTRHDVIQGRTQQQPFDIDTARKTCEDWRNTEARMPDAESFLETIEPMYLADAPGGNALLTKDEKVLERGKIAFANSCASCHSSKQPPKEIAINPEKAKQWYLQSVLSSDFLDGNFLSDDKRYPITLIGTNAARALGTNAKFGHLWEQFSSKTYKQLPSPGKLTLENPFDTDKPIEFEVPGGGTGYYRTPSLVNAWATAPFFHNNSLGKYTKDPSVAGRVNAYTDAMEKLLWSEKREGIIKRTTTDSALRLPLGIRIPIPQGTPVNLLANLDQRNLISKIASREFLEKIDLSGKPQQKLTNLLLQVSQSPDFIEDKGHPFGWELSDEDKKALIEFVKTF